MAAIKEDAVMEEQIVKPAQSDDAESIFRRFIDEVVKECETVFSSEESNGKYLDLNSHY